MAKKAVLIGDDMIPTQMFVDAAGPLRAAGYEVDAFGWMWRDFEELQMRLLSMEKGGPEAEPPPAEMAERIADAEIIILQFCPVPRRILEAGKCLKAVGVARAGVENVDLKAATECGVAVLHTIGRNASAVAEFSLSLILNEMRNIARAHEMAHNGRWFASVIDISRTRELNRKTVGIVGFGSVGRVLAKRLSGFEPRILVHDPFVPADVVRAAGAEPVDLDTLMSASDVISVNARLSAETANLIDERRIRLMKPTAYIVNDARAGLIEEGALLRALQERRIAGAGLDVFWEEPLSPGSPWLQLDNVTITAHLAGSTQDALITSCEMTVEAVLDYIEKGKTDLVMNKAVLAR